MTALIFATENETSINEFNSDKYETPNLIQKNDSLRNICLMHISDEIIGHFWIQLFFYVYNQ